MKTTLVSKISAVALAAATVVPAHAQLNSAESTLGLDAIPEADISAVQERCNTLAESESVADDPEGEVEVESDAAGEVDPETAAEAEADLAAPHDANNDGVVDTVDVEGALGGDIAEEGDEMAAKGEMGEAEPTAEASVNATEVDLSTVTLEACIAAGYVEP